MWVLFSNCESYSLLFPSSRPPLCSPPLPAPWPYFSQPSFSRPVFLGSLTSSFRRMARFSESHQQSHLGDEGWYQCGLLAPAGQQTKDFQLRIHSELGPSHPYHGLPTVWSRGEAEMGISEESAPSPVKPRAGLDRGNLKRPPNPIVPSELSKFSYPWYTPDGPFL